MYVYTVSVTFSCRLLDAAEIRAVTVENMIELPLDILTCCAQQCARA